ncbi:hypothetical protein RES10_07550 [Staphylococcus cohnii]|nr:hypothetical protein RES9_10250 [Staphylococcus cohnii]OIS31135.1 hypothetical protein RES10_07550 [Staphylococcus cohnii]OIS33451.1 hypothetical protein RES8_04370 [Staphylococcus cohnii]
MSERLLARTVSPGKHARSKSEDLKFKEDKSIVKDLPSYFEKGDLCPSLFSMSLNKIMFK